jgi:hypothetical protein
VSDSQAIDVQAIAAAVQAFAAVVVAVLTALLIGATNQYVRVTREQVAASQEQLAELREARAAASRPRLYPTGLGHAEGSNGVSAVQLRVSNFGGGPALDVHPFDVGVFRCDPPWTQLSEHAEQLFRFTPTGGGLDFRNTFVLLYHDLDDVRWRTRIETDLSIEGAGQGVTSVITERA